MSQRTDKAPDACYSPGLISVEQALAFLLARARTVAEVQEVDTAGALKRVLAHSQRSHIDVPGYDNSAMDGYAVHSSDIGADAETSLPVTQRIAAGHNPVALAPGEAARIFTGAPLPPGADAVVMQEHCTYDGERVRLRGPVKAGTWVRRRGNDIAAGAEILPQGTRIRAQEMGLAASVGLAVLPVRRRLRVAIFSSGDELMSPGQPLAPGQIYNSNRYVLLGLLRSLGCETTDLGTVADDLESTRAALHAAASNADLVVTSGGVSVGEEDHIKRAVETVGQLDLWRIAVKPGKPLAFGRIGDADFLGLPGNPVSVLVTFCLFARPFALRRMGVADVSPKPIPVRADFDWRKPGDRREFVRARLERDERGDSVAKVFPRQGSDVLTSAVWAEGLVEIPAGVTVARGESVPYYSFADLMN